MPNREAQASHGNPLVGYGYDLLSRFVFATVGGLDALREGALTAIGIRPGMRVLELGCGTGVLTHKLLARGAEVTAVDPSQPMLHRARRRAPTATFEQCEITDYTARGEFDRVLFAFVLHELDHATRHRALVLARNALAPCGRVAIVDHAIPKGGIVPKAVSAFVHSFEPPSTVEWLRSGFDAPIVRAGLLPEKKQILADGTAIVIVANRVKSASFTTSGA
jgi:ubiquinone/menaquinone biosynthesis C-methylase UbiE